MSDREYEVLSVILCEEIRPEQGGKQSLLGVFDDELLVTEIPATLARFSFRIAIKMAAKTQPTNITVRVVFKGSSAPIFEYATDIAKGKGGTKRRLAFGFALSQAVFTEEGVYQIQFGLNQQATTVSEFSVRLPTTKEERRLLGM